MNKKWSSKEKCFDNSTTRLRSKKNWREPSALNLWNPSAQHMTSIKKLRFSSRRRTKVRHQGPRDSTRAQPWTNIFRVWARPCYCTNPTITFKMSHQKTIEGSFCPLQHLEKDPKKKITNFQYSELNITSRAQIVRNKTCQMLKIVAK